MFDPDSLSARYSVGGAGRSGDFLLWALFGPPEPVLVITFTGTQSSYSEAQLVVTLNEAIAVSDVPRYRKYFGCYSVAKKIVLDLREATLAFSALLLKLHESAGMAGHPLLVVLSEESIDTYASAGLDVPLSLLHSNLSDAALSDVDC